MGVIDWRMFVKTTKGKVWIDVVPGCDSLD